MEKDNVSRLWSVRPNPEWRKQWMYTTKDYRIIGRNDIERARITFEDIRPLEGRFAINITAEMQNGTHTEHKKQIVAGKNITFPVFGARALIEVLAVEHRRMYVQIGMSRGSELRFQVVELYDSDPPEPDAA